MREAKTRKLIQKNTRNEFVFLRAFASSREKAFYLLFPSVPAPLRESLLILAVKADYCRYKEQISRRGAETGLWARQQGASDRVRNQDIGLTAWREVARVSGHQRQPMLRCHGGLHGVGQLEASATPQTRCRIGNFNSHR